MAQQGNQTQCEHPAINLLPMLHNMHQLNPGGDQV
jgi:hypothetical protein